LLDFLTLFNKKSGQEGGMRSEEEDALMVTKPWVGTGSYLSC